MTRTRIKICCISSHEEARLAISHGVDALGLVSAMPSGPGVIDESLIQSIARDVPPPVGTFLLTSATDADAIIAQARKCGPSALQLVDAVAPRVISVLRGAVPGIRLVQVIHVLGEESIAEAIAIAPLVDALLLDSGNPTLAVKELGGTGRVHNWDLSRRIVDSVEKPVFLAGGLNASNVAEAIRTVRPFGVDVCSGVRLDGQLNAARLAAFVSAVASA